VLVSPRPEGGAPPAEPEIRAALNEIVDPCSVRAGAPAGLVEMGLVRVVEVKPARSGVSVRVVVGLTEPGCLMGMPFMHAVRKRLEELEGVGEFEVELDASEIWTTDDLDPAYAARLETVRRRRGLPIVSSG
jgi:metal-sulfur cluster biosynthetic enzyme